MAGMLLSATSGERSLVAATAQTVLQVVAPANQRLKIRQIKVLGKQSAGGTDQPAKMRLTRSTGSFGTRTAVTPGKFDPGSAETVQSTAFSTFTVEPTSPADLGDWSEVQLQVGLILPFPPGMEVIIPGGNALNVELTAPASATVVVTVYYEE